MIWSKKLDKFNQKRNNRNKTVKNVLRNQRSPKITYNYLVLEYRPRINIEIIIRLLTKTSRNRP